MSKDWNYVTQMFMQKCSVTDVSILIRTAFEAAIPTMYDLSEYTCSDIMTMRGGHTWGPAAVAFKGINKAPRRSGVRRLGGCGLKLSATNGGLGAFDALQIDQFKFLYNITGLAFARSVLFKFFLFEVGKDFLINWMTLAYAAEKCDLPPLGVIYTNWGALCTPGGGGPITCFIGPGQTQGAHCGGHEIFIDPGVVATISWGGQWTAFRGDPANRGNVKMWLEDDEGRQYDVTTSTLRASPNTATVGGGIYNIPAALPSGTVWRLKAQIESGLMCQVDNPPPTLCINTTGKPINFLPLGGCGKQLGHFNDMIWGLADGAHWRDGFGDKVLNPWFRDLKNFVAGERKPPDPLP